MSISRCACSDSDTWLQTRDGHREPAATHLQLVGDPKRYPDVGGFACLRASSNVPAKIGRHHADNRRRLLVESDPASDDVAVATESSLPESITDHSDARLSFAVVFSDKRSTEGSIGSEYRENIGGGILSRYLLRFTIVREVESAIEEHRHIGKYLVLLFPVCEITEIDHVLIGSAALSLLPHHHDLFGIGIGKRAQQDCVDDTKDRSVGADAEREREESNKRHHRALQKHPRAKPNVS